MSKQLDLSKPLSKETVAELKAHHTLEYTDRMVALAQGSDFEDEGKPARRRSSAKKDEEKSPDDASADAEAPAEG